MGVSRVGMPEWLCDEAIALVEKAVFIQALAGNRPWSQSIRRGHTSTGTICL